MQTRSTKAAIRGTGITFKAYAEGVTIKKVQVKESKNNRTLESKTCSRCKIMLAVSSFQWVKNSHLRAGGCYHSYCKKCRYNSISEASKEAKRKADAERVKAKYGTPEYIAIQKRSIEKRKAERLATWHERNAGKYCPMVWHACAGCGYKQQLKGAAMVNYKRTEYCKSCVGSYIGQINTGKKCKTFDHYCVDCSCVIHGTAAKKRCNKCQTTHSNRLSRIRGDKQRTDRDVRHRARRHGVYIEPVNRLKVYERDGWQCYLCGVRLIKSQTYHPNKATIDHVIPMVKGGSHTYDNVRACCHRCNALKSDSIIETHGAPQQRVGL